VYVHPFFIGESLMSIAPSSAQRFFDRITSAPDPAAFIRALAPSDPPTFEGDWLDFKRPCSPDDTKRIGSKALSGFANTEGGVIVWGVIANKDPSGVDAANGIALVQNPAAAVSRLMQLHHVATDPPVAGVDVRPVLDTGTSDEGFVVCYVPESSYKPHRAEYVEGKPYFIRAGDDFVMPSPALLRHLFYPKTSAVLQIVAIPGWELWTGLQDLRPHKLRYDIRIQNIGTATARDEYIVMSTPGMGLNAEPRWVKHGDLRGIGLSGTEPIHPGMVSKLCWMTHSPENLNCLPNDPRKPIPVVPVQLEFLLHCLDHEQQVVTITIAPTDFKPVQMVFSKPKSIRSD
jgi:hypothetical protein